MCFFQLISRDTLTAELFGTVNSCSPLQVELSTVQLGDPIQLPIHRLAAKAYIRQLENEINKGDASKYLLNWDSCATTKINNFYFAAC